MKILLLGKDGQVGWELQRSLAPLGELVALDRRDADLSQPDQLRETVLRLRPAVVVNAAAYTAVDKAESEPELAHAVNALAPGVLAVAADEVGALMVHFSTDYVFDGSGDTPRSETATTGPLSVYGQTKLEGEQRIQAACARHLILRTSWVHAARGGNFARTMLRLAKEREELKVIDDQIGAPTGADLIADLTAHAIRQAVRDPACLGTCHLAAAGETSWHGYARFVLETARELQPELTLRAREVLPIPTSAYPTAARRPLNSRLDTTRLRQTFGLSLPRWETGVRRMLAEILGPTGQK
ncbi:dTDP-4-dehydrorhamnose reductase [Hydrogenophaga sp. IBVHS1]|uniref:dTDP-4-dehydrorhamnose reductase n=1 Tax=unclassified Hydrogenophaga TaxID=2610897 RepID=UPI000A2E8D2A|nr:dTDP-4-dehydrorhamnose reductase [Hydrogenophaga sp. IBVHS1]OSZ71820.1 dTDP-4-dehydrorhamnose reductase [Hydrogenophaga sp. IBVHS1]